MESENSIDSDSSSSDNGDHDSNLHSMTGKSIVKDMVKEQMKLKTQVSTQKGLVRELIDGVYLKLLSEKTMESFIEESELDEAPPSSDIPSDVLMLYKSVISDMKAMLTLESTLVAENSRISAPELQKALVGICRLAARSFMKLYGETSPFASEFIQWVYEEIEVFAVSFARYVISVSETILRKSSASLLQLMVIGERLEFCLLTSSGRNLVTVLQAITGDVTPLIALQLEDSILRGLMNLFSEYIAILEEPSPLKQMIQA
ncbi:hypothetical protein OIU85_010634 [Salix viminalis]|uniref:Exocyst component Exo84 C-terminal domain-containing protein n=1 Tax=Salix viminalis TaxID=40686 RepID=A0A9Q0NR57_SALVM|nr:hypothetical protein OIU85_010634 [Salix viminalis]